MHPSDMPPSSDAHLPLPAELLPMAFQPHHFRPSMFRMAEAALVFGKNGAHFLFDRLKRQRATLPRRLRHSFEALGPTFIKFGQLIASSPGIFPRAVADEFQACLDRMPPLSFEVIRGILQRELGDKLSQFKRLDELPLATASMAQVHAAELVDGRRVVLKILRPNIRPQIQRDIGNMLAFARLLERFHKTSRMANPLGVVEDFSRTLLEELDLSLEARSMARYREILLEGFEFQIDIPEVYPEFCTQQVLVMERLEGIRADDKRAVKTAGINAEECLLRLMRATLRSVMFHGLFHGDLHAGNLRLAEGDRVVLMDFGLMGRLNQEERKQIAWLFVAMAKRNFRGMAEALLALEKLPPAQADAFAVDLEKTLRPIMRSKVGDMNFGRILQSVIELGARHNLRLPKALILLLKQLLYVDRFAHLLAPGFNPFKDVRTIDFVWEEPLGQQLYPDLLERLLSPVGSDASGH
ncbi:MAG: ABC1 kinase family protein [Myxococcota bacterium]